MTVNGAEERERVYRDIKKVYGLHVTEDQLAARLKPRAYQVEMIQFLERNPRALCYDLVGAGKTLEASEAAVGHKPVLVVAPGYLCTQWYEFLRMQYPDDIVVHAGESVRPVREEALSLPYDWMIVTHEMVRKHKSEEEQKMQMNYGERQRIIKSYDVMNVLWHYPKTVIVDEFHHFRGRSSAQAKGLLDISKHPSVERMIGLTATPVYREVDDLFMEGHILLPDDRRFRSYYAFVDEYCLTYNNGYKQQVVRPRSKAAIEELMASIGKGRSYRKIGFQLPPLITMPTIKIDFSPQELKIYRTLRDYYSTTLLGDDGTIDRTVPLDSASAALHEMRKFTVTPAKIAAIKSICDDTRAGPNPNVVIFCWYRDTAAALATALSPYSDCITGEMSPGERSGTAKSKTHPIKVVTISALSEGVDLSHAPTIIYAEEDYTPGAMFQSTGRVRRNPDSPFPVVLYHIHVKGSVDEVVHSAIQHRLSSVGAIVRDAIRGDD